MKTFSKFFLIGCLGLSAPTWSMEVETPSDIKSGYLLYQCRICNKESVDRCPICREAYYCSMECQKKDFEKHQSECTEWTGSTDQIERSFVGNMQAAHNEALHEDNIKLSTNRVIDSLCCLAVSIAQKPKRDQKKRVKRLQNDCRGMGKEMILTPLSLIDVKQATTDAIAWVADIRKLGPPSQHACEELNIKLSTPSTQNKKLYDATHKLITTMKKFAQKQIS